MTIVVELVGGPGSGKTSASWELAAELKRRRDLSVDLAPEYVKKWVWEGRKISPHDQLYLTAKQARSESMLYGNVDVVITDSPVWVQEAYASVYAPGTVNVIRATYECIAPAARRVRLFVRRVKPYDPRGRVQTAEGAAAFDVTMRDLAAARGYKLEDWVDAAHTADLLYRIVP